MTAVLLERANIIEKTGALVVLVGGAAVFHGTNETMSLLVRHRPLELPIAFIADNFWHNS